MNKKKIFPAFFALTVFLLSCSLLSSQKAIKSVDFSLKEKWGNHTVDDVHSIACSDNWIAIATLFDLTAVDPNSGVILWAKKYQLDADSKLLLADEMLIVSNSETINLVEKSGAERGVIRLDPSMGSSKIIAVIEHYIFVVRYPSWTLEVYDINNAEIIWSTPIERGGIRIHQSDTQGIAYTTTLDNITAINLSNGDGLWQLDKRVVASDYKTNTLYYIGRKVDKDSKYYIAALSMPEGNEIWTRDITSQSPIEILNVKILDKSVVVTLRTGVIAFDKDNGRQLWQSETHDQFPTEPILLDGAIYIKGPMSKTIYKISPETGTNLERLQYGNTVIFGQPAFEYNNGVHLCNKTLVFSESNTVYGYGK